MKKKSADNHAMRLKDAYDNTEIPPDVSERIWSRIKEQEYIAQSPLARPALAFAALACCVAALLVLFRFYTIEPEESNTKETPNQLVARVVEMSDGAQIVKDRKHQPAEEGMYLEGESKIRTTTSNAVVEIGQHRVNVKKHSVFNIVDVSKKKMKFSLVSGTVEFRVAKLPKGSGFTVQSGNLTVSVVGTAFSVSRNNRCGTVDVQEGRVKVEFEEQTVFVSAGEKGEFCDKASPDKTQPAAQSQPPRNVEDNTEPSVAPRPTRNRAIESAPKSRKAKRPVTVDKAVDTKVEEPEAKDTDTLLTEEEQLIKSAQELIAKNDRRKSLEVFKEYIVKYPGGLFAEEALFNIVRQSYWLKRMKDVVKYSEIFLSTHSRPGYRSTEIRIIRAQGLLELKEPPRDALNALEPAMNRPGSLPKSYRGQAMYLYALAAHRAGQKEKCTVWARKYLASFPNGRYANEVKKIIGEKNAE
ncbi:MAG: FecR domain-containing protein [Deltaproteobacteria bacterium]|nr:FecR domain-containing protein [Deltaproteobacteria bacterium]